MGAGGGVAWLPSERILCLFALISPLAVPPTMSLDLPPPPSTVYRQCQTPSICRKPLRQALTPMARSYLNKTTSPICVRMFRASTTGHRPPPCVMTPDHPLQCPTAHSDPPLLVWTANNPFKISTACFEPLALTSTAHDSHCPPARYLASSLSVLISTHCPSLISARNR